MDRQVSRSVNILKSILHYQKINNLYLTSPIYPLINFGKIMLDCNVFESNIQIFPEAGVAQ
jgi:hypothetical protein